MLLAHASSYINYDQNNWVALLPHLVFAYNNSPSDLTGGKSPLFVEYEQHPLLPIDLSDAILTDASDPDIESRLRRLE
eukprot:SAG11_NODE_35623_length_265_cov_2.457831_1_plen_77_part_10